MGILPIRELARIPARDPVGRFRPALAAADGAQNQEQQQEQKRLCFRLSLFASARRTRALCSSRGPMALRAAADEKARRGGARDRADSAVAQDVQSAEPGRWRGPDAHDARRAQGAGACFFAYFLCTSKESRPLAEGEWKPLL